MANGSVLLRRYLKSTGQRAAHVAQATKIDKSLISRWLRDPKRKPGLEHACLLERFTKGAVPACSWLK